MGLGEDTEARGDSWKSEGRGGGTESGRGSLTGAAAAPACPSVKVRASAASSLSPASLGSPTSGPRLPRPGEPWRRRT